MMPTPYFQEEHDLLRDQIRKFVNNEVIPYADQWEKVGMPSGPDIQMAYDGLRIDLHADS